MNGDGICLFLSLWTHSLGPFVCSLFLHLMLRMRFVFRCFVFFGMWMRRRDAQCLRGPRRIVLFAPFFSLKLFFEFDFAFSSVPSLCAYCYLVRLLLPQFLELILVFDDYVRFENTRFCPVRHWTGLTELSELVCCRLSALWPNPTDSSSTC